MEHDDFFEDDLDYEEPAPKKAPGKSKGKGKAKPLAKSSARSPREMDETPMVSLNWVIAIAVAALIVGFVARGMFQPTQQLTTTAATGAAGTTQGTGTTQLPPGHPQVQPGQQAPPLSQDQINQGLKGTGTSTGTGSSKKP